MECTFNIPCSSASERAILACSSVIPWPGIPDLVTRMALHVSLSFWVSFWSAACTRSCFSAWRPAWIDWISVMTVSGLMLLRSVFESLRLPDAFADVLLARLWEALSTLSGDFRLTFPSASGDELRMAASWLRVLTTLSGNFVNERSIVLVWRGIWTMRLYLCKDSSIRFRSKQVVSMQIDTTASARDNGFTKIAHGFYQCGLWPSVDRYIHFFVSLCLFDGPFPRLKRPDQRYCQWKPATRNAKAMLNLVLLAYWRLLFLFQSLIVDFRVI